DKNETIPYLYIILLLPIKSAIILVTLYFSKLKTIINIETRNGIKFHGPRLNVFLSTILLTFFFKLNIKTKTTNEIIKINEIIHIGKSIYEETAKRIVHIARWMIPIISSDLSFILTSSLIFVIGIFSCFLNIKYKVIN